MRSLVLISAAAALAALARPSVPGRAQVQYPDSLAPALVAQGDSIFHGKLAAGLCYTCHGADAKGLPGLAPNLADTLWLHGDGSYAFIIKTVNAGIPRPKQAIAPMLPMGGARLTPQQVRAVSSYVLSLSAGKRPVLRSHP